MSLYITFASFNFFHSQLTNSINKNKANLNYKSQNEQFFIIQCLPRADSGYETQFIKVAITFVTIDQHHLLQGFPSWGINGTLPSSQKPTNSQYPSQYPTRKNPPNSDPPMKFNFPLSHQRLIPFP